jgi:phospholipase/lecithinase/hemolysin
MGGNDVRDALVAFSGGGAGGILGAANTAIFLNIKRLHEAGARNFLVWTAPNVGLTPAIRTLNQLNPGAAFLASSLSQGFNAGLNGVLASLSQLEGITIRRLDAYGLLNNIVANPAAFGLANVTQPCVTPSVPPYRCSNPDEFLFWDGIHPSKAGHAIISQEAASVLVN